MPRHNWPLFALIWVVVGFVFFLLEQLLGRKASVRIEQEQEDLIVRRTVSGLTRYLDGLPGVTNPAIKGPFDAGMKLMDSSKWDEAIVEFHKALPLAKATQRVALYGLIGLCYYAPGKPDDALASYEESLSLARELKDQRGAAAALGNIGAVYQVRGDFDQALSCYEQALQIAREIGFQQGAADNLGNIGLIYYDKGDLDQALKFLQDALTLVRQIGYQPGIAAALANIGLIRKNKGSLDQALKCYLQSLRIYDQIGVAYGSDIVMGNLARLSRRMGPESFLSACEKQGMSCSEADALAARLPPPKT
jgi:tetratricopeptide (TPR) repeat protein